MNKKLSKKLKQHNFRNRKNISSFAREFAKLKPETIYVSEEVWNQLQDAIKNPPAPNEKLKEAGKRFRERFPNN